MIYRLSAAAVLAAVAVPALAQSTASAPSAAPVSASSAAVVTPSAAAQQPSLVVTPDTSNVLHAGLPVQLETRDELTTEHKALKVGQQVEMQVIQPVLLNSQVVIAAGTRALGEVTTVRNKGMWGKSGGITVKVLYIEANGHQIRLNGTFNEHGDRYRRGHRSGCVSSGRWVLRDGNQRQNCSGNARDGFLGGRRAGAVRPSCARWARRPRNSG